MTSEPRWHPDLLRRFVAAPYVFSSGDSFNSLQVESNDLEIALGVRNSDIIQRTESRSGGFLCRLIRDMPGPVDGLEISILSDGPLRILRRGSGTVLIHDRERAELLGFVSRTVPVQELVSSLIPRLLGAQSEEKIDSTAFTKK
jgi:hypothetical protein